MGSGLNLIPAPLLAQRRGRRRVRQSLRVIAVYLCVLLLGTLGFLGTHAPRATLAAAGELAVSEDRLSMLRQQVAVTQADLVQTRRRIEGGRVLSERPDWSTLLRLLAHTAGPTVVLHRLAIDTTGPAITAGAAVRLAGLTDGPAEVSAFALRLEASGLFDRVSIVGSRREPFRDRIATAFEVECTLVGDDPDDPEEAR
jgi:Tfp pilus assembly protein PilN